MIFNENSWSIHETITNVLENKLIFTLKIKYFTTLFKQFREDLWRFPHKVED